MIRMRSAAVILLPLLLLGALPEGSVVSRAAPAPDGAQQPAATDSGDMDVVCEDGLCRLVPRQPANTDILAEATGETGAPPVPNGQDARTESRLFPGYRVKARGMGDIGAARMENLLKGISVRQRRSLAQSFAAAFVGGILLNLTPCVLPLIPVTLLVLGLGGNRRAVRPAATGVAYGLGMTVSYGALGVAALAFGTAFGSLQSSPWFSAAVAAMLLLLSLAMFGVFSLDFSSLRPASPMAQARERGGAGRLAAAFGAGVAFALMAGACVAPVVLETLVAAFAWQASGARLAWLLPFALGLGMGAPWMLLGGGIRRILPRPGAWMVWVNRAFGVVAVVLALHYARLAWSGFRGPSGDTGTESAGGIAWRTDPAAALAEARASGSPIFVDLWASWCRNCESMERGTMRDPRVARAMDGIVPLRLRCEDPNTPDAVALFEEMGFTSLRGLPAYALLVPETTP